MGGQKMDDLSNVPFEAVHRAKDPGTWIWNVTDDRLIGNEQLACLFGLNPSDVQRGMPLQAYIDHIHPADRSVMLRAMCASVTDCGFYSSQYRILHDEREVHVFAFGRCFLHGFSPRAKFHVGIVFDGSGLLSADSRDQEDMDLDQIEHACLTAHSLSLRNGYSGMSKALQFILEEVDHRSVSRIEA
jgi:hypothetical protein